MKNVRCTPLCAIFFRAENRNGQMELLQLGADRGQFFKTKKGRGKEDSRLAVKSLEREINEALREEA